MSYRVVIAHEAEKILDRLDRPTEQRICSRIIQLAEDPFKAVLDDQSVLRNASNAPRSLPESLSPNSCPFTAIVLVP